MKTIRTKGRGAQQTAEILAALECVDYVIVFDELTPEVMLARLQPDIHCKGTDYAPPHGKPIPERAIVEGYGGRVEFLALMAGCSTTELIRRARQADESADYFAGTKERHRAAHAALAE